MLATICILFRLNWQAIWQHSKYSCQNGMMTMMNEAELFVCHTKIIVNANTVIIEWMKRQCNHINCCFNCSNGRNGNAMRWSERMSVQKKKRNNSSAYVRHSVCSNYDWRSIAFWTLVVRRSFWLHVFHVIFELQWEIFFHRQQVNWKKRENKHRREHMNPTEHICIRTNIIMACFFSVGFLLRLHNNTNTVNYKTQSIVISVLSMVLLSIHTHTHTHSEQQASVSAVFFL